MHSWEKDSTKNEMKMLMLARGTGKVSSSKRPIPTHLTNCGFCGEISGFQFGALLTFITIV